MSELTPADWRELAARHTPARILQGRTGGAYLTTTQLQLRADHAAARDSVQAEFTLADFPTAFLTDTQLCLVETRATSKAEYLLQPELGRQFGPAACAALQARNTPDVDVQFLVGDGLSALAAQKQVPRLLPGLLAGARERGWTVDLPIGIRYCRVGILNAVGALLRPRIAVLLIGERPGLATAESLSVYMAYRPNDTQTDAHRNLISNIHQRGLPPQAAIPRVLNLMSQLLTAQISGVTIKEQLPALSGQATLPQT